MMKLSQGAVHRETLLYAVYYAPRGSYRLYLVAAELAQKYLTPTDLIIGILGAEGSGKSTLIKGLFPGLELTNDDEGINVRPTPLYDFDPADAFSGHTFHVDARYELAFHQKYELAEAILNADRAQPPGHRRALRSHLRGPRHNAQVLIGIGEEIIVARPTVFGPFPEAIKTIVDKTIKYRLMAHSAEDITGHDPRGGLQDPAPAAPLRRPPGLRPQLQGAPRHRPPRARKEGPGRHRQGRPARALRRQPPRHRRADRCPARGRGPTSPRAARSRTSGWSRNTATTT